MVAQTTQVILQITDALMIGRLGAVDLAASAFASSLFALFMVFSMSFTASIATLVAQARGARRHYLIFENFKHGAILSLIVGVLSFAILSAFVPALDLFGQPAAVAEAATPYLFCLALSCLPMALQNAIRQFSEGLGNVKTPMLVALFGVVLNVALNFLLIYGLYGFPRLELLGAGVATLISRSTMAGMMLWILFRSPFFRVYLPKRWSRSWRRKLALRNLQIGLPTASYSLFEIGAFSSVTIFVGWFGATALAAHQIVLNMATLTYVITLSLGYAATIRVGFAFGQKDFEACRRIGVGVGCFAFCFMSLSALVLFLLREQLPSWYISDSEVIALGAKLIVIAAVFQIFDGLQSVTTGVLRGYGDVQVPMLLCFVAYWVLGLPLGLFVGFSMGLEAVGLWIGLALGLGVMALVLSARFLRLSSRWMKGKTS